MDDWQPDEARLIIDGILELNARLADISTDLAAIRALLEEDDGRGDEEED